jgi:hypothetical protein
MRRNPEIFIDSPRTKRVARGKHGEGKYLQSGKRPGRMPIGKRAMTRTERTRKFKATHKYAWVRKESCQCYRCKDNRKLCQEMFDNAISRTIRKFVSTNASDEEIQKTFREYLREARTEIILRNMDEDFKDRLRFV